MTVQSIKLSGIVVLGLVACSSSSSDQAASGVAMTPGSSAGRAAAGVEAAVPARPAGATAPASPGAGGTPAQAAPAAAGSSSIAAAGSGGSPATATAGNHGESVSAAAGSSGSPASAGAAGMAHATAAGSGGFSGVGAAGSPAADSGMASLKDCGEGATMGKDRKAATKPAGTGRHSTGSVDFKVKAGNRIVRLQTTLLVPPKPKGNSTLFMWPGLEPLEGVSMNFNPIGRGVLQPVLTWGTSCAPGSRAGANNWWISALYVNVTSRERGYNGCYGGKVMDVEIGDKLYIDMRLKEGTTLWNQKVTNLSNDKSVDFDFDLKDQDQNWALFEIEVASSTLPSSDVIFTDSVLTWAKPEPEACTPDAFGPNDYYTAPLISRDGTKCCLERIVLREMGVAATTMDP